MNYPQLALNLLHKITKPSRTKELEQENNRLRAKYDKFFNIEEHQSTQIKKINDRQYLILLMLIVNMLLLILL